MFRSFFGRIEKSQKSSRNQPTFNNGVVIHPRQMTACRIQVKSFLQNIQLLRNNLVHSSYIEHLRIVRQIRKSTTITLLFQKWKADSCQDTTLNKSRGEIFL